MKIRQKALASLESGYAVAVTTLNKQLYYLAGSEAEGGGCMLISARTGRIHPLQGLSGGIMSIVPVPERPGAFLAIQKFYPIFRSERAEIVYVQMIPQQDGTVSCNVKKICALPFVHRITLAGSEGSRRIVAATLCREKQFIEDWSTEGAVYEIMLSDALNGTAVPNMIFTGIHKNHGMFQYQSGGSDVVVVSGEEGVFELALHRESVWSIQKILAEPTGDIWMYDIDGDGADELITIQPFHGENLRIYRRQGDRWEVLREFELRFGHSIWAGNILGKAYIFGASRAGAKELSVYRVESGIDENCVIERKAVYEGLGIAQLAVCSEGDTVRVVTSNHGLNEVGEFVFSNDVA